jgi:hypothetical protein
VELFVRTQTTAKKHRKQLTLSLEQLLLPHDFIIDTLSETKDCSYHTLKKVVSATQAYSFGYFFTGGKSKSLDPFIKMSHKTVDNVLKNFATTYYEPNFFLDAGWLTSPKNADGFCHSNEDCSMKEVTSDDTPLYMEKMVNKLYQYYFLQAMPRYMTLTKDLETIDQLINQPVLQTQQMIGRHVLFASEPTHILMGTVVAKLINNPDYKRLVEIYTQYVEDFDPERTVYDVISFHQAVKYFG